MNDVMNLVSRMSQEEIAQMIQRAQAFMEAKGVRRSAWEAYMEEERAYDAACQAWAEEWTAKLWEPWHVWKVRYVAYDDLFAATEAKERFPIETVYTLDEPEDIVKSMRPVALVDRVHKQTGEVSPGFALATFLDAKRIDYAEAEINLHLPHHRSYTCGTYVVNVPAHVLAVPGPGPVEPVIPEVCA